MPAKQRRRTISQLSEMVYDVHEFGIVTDTREIFVSPPMNDPQSEAFIDHTVAHRFIRNLRILESINSKPILIHMATCGGDWSYGMAMYDVIKHSPCEITMLSYAHARSMSSIIPQAADIRVIMPNACYLIHYGEFGTFGNFTNAMAEAAWYKMENERFMDLYTERIQHGPFFQREGYSAKKVREWLVDNIDKKQEFYMTPREALDKGFTDGIFGEEGYENIDELLRIKE